MNDVQNTQKIQLGLKAKVAIKAIKEQRTISELAQEFEIHLNQVSHWKREFLERSAQVFVGDKNQADELVILEQNHRLAHRPLEVAMLHILLPPGCSF